jgi:hypothetical protein
VRRKIEEENKRARRKVQGRAGMLLLCVVAGSGTVRT